jgi:hypothetical protein
MGPIRNFSGLYAAPGDSSSSTAAGSSSLRTKPPQGEPPVREAVGLAYRVIEKHISDGKRNAEMLNSQPYINTRAVTDSFQEVLDRTIRYQSELIPLWLEALTSAVRVDSPRIPKHGSPHEVNDVSDRLWNNISIEIASSRPIEVQVNLREHSEMLPLVALGLRAVDGNKPVLSEISFAPEPSSRTIKLRLEISDTVPADTYSGVVVNRETGEPLGTLSVRIAE